MGILNRKNKRNSPGIGLADRTRRPPRPADEQDAPRPERLTRPEEELDVAVPQSKDPPQTEEPH